MRREAVQDRLARLSVPEPNSGCTLFLGYRDRHGYGRIGYGRGAALAHRVAYLIEHGAVPGDLTLDHLCRNRACVNVSHMEAVTRRVNTLRGRGWAAKRAAAEMCAKGHPFDEGNTYQRSSGRRGCRACNQEAVARYRARKKGGVA